MAVSEGFHKQTFPYKKFSDLKMTENRNICWKLSSNNYMYIQIFNNIRLKQKIKIITFKGFINQIH